MKTAIMTIALAVTMLSCAASIIFLVMYFGEKNKRKELADRLDISLSSLKMLRELIEELQVCTVHIEDDTPADNRPNTKVMKLQNKLTKYILEQDGKIFIDIIDNSKLSELERNRVSRLEKDSEDDK